MNGLLWVDFIAQILILVGALNWGCIGLFQVDVVKELFGYGKLTTMVYNLVGFAALYLIIKRIIG